MFPIKALQQIKPWMFLLYWKVKKYELADSAWIKDRRTDVETSCMWPPIAVTSGKPLSMSLPTSSLLVLYHLGPMFTASISLMSGQKYMATLKIILRWNPHSGFPWHVLRCCICTKWLLTDVERARSQVPTYWDAVDCSKRSSFDFKNWNDWTILDCEIYLECWIKC